MDISLEDFHQDFIQTVYAEAESRSLLRAVAFYEIFSERLNDFGDLTEYYNIAEYNKNQIKICGYDYDEERQIFTILGYKFYQTEVLQSITLAEIESSFKGMELYLSKCNDSDFIQQLEETQAAFTMSHNIYSKLSSNEIIKFRFLLLTDGRATKNLTTIPSKKILDYPVEYSVVDLNYLYQQFKSLNTGGDYDTPVNIKCLRVNFNDKYQSFLTVINGKDLVDIYDKFGQKLFEQNVRTFLQFKGAVNRGLKNTLQNEPDMFFAYNNGITATATQVDFDSEDSNLITNIKNLQIVNGGQTTSSIYAASKINKIDVSQVFVQIKLSVVKDQQKVYEFVSNVSEYANTQNKVSISDFYSNSMLHKEFKQYSQRIFVPQIGGAQTRNHWFYERVRGEYLNEQAYLTSSQKNLFKLQYPKSQFFDKNFLAKVQVAWLCKPDIVSKGAQDSAKYFKKVIDETLEKSSVAITEVYFKDAVSKVILFKHIEKLVSDSEWYRQAYRSQTVAYTLSYLSYFLNKTKTYFNFAKIWNEQCINEDLSELLLKISENIYDYIIKPRKDAGNPAQWTKREQCWLEIQKLIINVVLPTEYLISKNEKYDLVKESKDLKKLDKDIDIQIFIVNQSKSFWTSLFTYFSNNELINITAEDIKILQVHTRNYTVVPTKKVYLTLYKLYLIATKDGWKP